MQENPEIVNRYRLVARRLQYAPRVRLEFLEQRMDDLLLTLKVVVQVARADIDLVGDVVGPGIRFAVLVEQQQARDEDAVARVQAHALRRVALTAQGEPLRAAGVPGPRLGHGDDHP